MRQGLIILILAIGMAFVVSKYVIPNHAEHEKAIPFLDTEELSDAEKMNRHPTTLNVLSQNTRSLDDVYSRRAYPGAPPVIPHPAQSKNGNPFKDCLSCHEKGGWSPKLQAWTPVTPHPNFTHCQQCHVFQDNQAQAFNESEWKKIQGPPLGNSALGGSPPMIPHTLQLRENCLSCHSGPSAPKEIRTGHPERIHCRQCHVPLSQISAWIRQSTP